MTDTFLGEDLFEADITTPVQERVDNAVKRVQELALTSKATMGRPIRGGGRQQQYNMPSDYNNDFMPGSQAYYGRFNGNGNFGGNIGGSRGNGVGTCLICGSTGHQAKQCRVKYALVLSP